jgi:hypothetical protein
VDTGVAFLRSIQADLADPAPLLPTANATVNRQAAMGPTTRADRLKPQQCERRPVSSTRFVSARHNHF